MYVRMYVCTYVCMYVCMYVCILYVVCMYDMYVVIMWGHHRDFKGAGTHSYSDLQGM